MVINPVTDLLILKDGTTISFTFDNYTLTATADGDAASTISLTPNGISVTPEIGDGKLNLTLSSTTGSGSISADIEILSGSFLFGPNGTLTVTKDTELEIDFGNDYIINFKATDEAGGVLSLGSDGITFKPNSDDGGLELTVKRGEDTRTASLNVTGSVTYKLDGSISLTQGTVVKNVFDDGNILTITANTDASGSIIFNPQTGLTVTPKTADALTVSLKTGDTEIVNITSIDGSITYQNGIVTASDGTKVNLVYNNTWETKLSTTGGTASSQFTADRTVHTANEGATFVLEHTEDGLKVEIQNGSLIDIYATETSDAIELISASSTFGSNDEEFVFTLGTAGNYTLNGMKVVTTADNAQVQLSNYNTVIVDGISYTPLDENVTLTLGENITTCAGGKITMQMDGFDTSLTFDTTDGSVSYGAGKFTVTKGAKNNLSGDGATQIIAQSDFDINVKENFDGAFNFSSDDSADIAIERDGEIIIKTTITLDGAIVVDPSTDQISLPKNTVVTFARNGNSALEITALDDAGGQLSFTDAGIRFAPNTSDGKLDLNFVGEERKATLDVTGAFIYGGDGNISLEDGTVVDLTWEDGNNFKLKSRGSTGSIKLDEDKGLRVTSADKNLDVVLTTADGYTTEIKSIEGYLWYKAGTVTLDESTVITGQNVVEGHTVGIKFEALDGDSSLHFAKDGITYSAGTGKNKVTYTLGEAESSFTLNKGSVFIQKRVFHIAEGTDLVTDFKEFIPAQYFQTQEAGTYTINGQTITTSAEGLKLTATDDYMAFVTSDDAVEYDGMTFAGKGNVSLKPDIVVLGKNIVAEGFDEGNSFMLAESGNVTADAKVFTLTELENKLGEKIPLNVSVEGAEDGFIFSRVITRESEDYFDKPEYENVGKIFAEKIIVHGDDSYRIRTAPIGLEEVIGISKDSTIEGGATLANKVSPNYYDLVTDTNGDFTIGENTYTIADDTKVGVVLNAAFDGDSAYVDAVKNLNGTISGNFSDGGFKVNGNASLNVYNDTDISIISSGKKYEILGLDDNASLKVSAAGTYSVNSTAIAAEAEDIIVGLSDGSARLYHDNFIENTLSNTLINGTKNDDYIINKGTAVTIQGHAGNDYIENNFDSSLVAASLGNSIDGGAGNDLISVGSGAALIEYAFGDGFDSILGFNSTATLSISGGKYTREINGDDMILTVGDETITIFGASSANIIGRRDVPVEEIAEAVNAKNQVSLSGGNQNLKFNDDGGNLAIVNGNGGNKTIELGDGGDAVAVYADKDSGTSVDVIGGAGSDTLIAFGSAPVTFNMSAGGADKIPLLFANQKVLFEGYDSANGGGIETGNPNIASMVEEIMAGKDTRFGNGKVSLKTSEETQSVFTLAENAAPQGSAIINFFDVNNRILPVGFTNQLGGIVDVSASSDAYLLLGNYFGSKSGGSTLFGGSGDDTILGGEGDLLDADGGNNQIYLAGGGAKIGLDNGGRTSVHNFQTDFDSAGDALYSKGDLAARIRFDGENITASVNGGAQVTLESVAADADFAELLLFDDEDLTKVAIAKPGGTIKSESAQIYLGREKGAGVDFSGMTDDLLVNLSNEPVVTGAEQKQFFMINQVIAGDGNSTLIGTSRNETLTAGNGNTSIWGGAGNDSLIGKGGSSDKNGSTTFFFEPGDGHDIIKDFEFLTAENQFDGTSDFIDIGENIIKDASISRGRVFIDFEDGNRLIIRDAVGKDFRIGDLVAKVDTNISYDGLANCYVAAGGSSLTVDSTVESAEIWLDNSHDTLFFGNIKTLDASAVKGNTSLVGNEFNNTLIAGHGDSSLWGGSSTTNDLLQGGAGKNTFFYLQGDGRDTIQGIHDGDEIILDNITLDQITSADISAAAVTVNFNDGGSLQINGTADVIYQLADGSKYSANHNSLEWIDR